MEDETNVVQSEFLQLFRTQLDQILAGDGDGTAGGQVNAAEGIEQGGFSGAGGTHDVTRTASQNPDISTAFVVPPPDDDALDLDFQ